MRGIWLDRVECFDCGAVVRHPVHRIEEGPYIDDDVCLACYGRRVIVMRNAGMFHRQSWWEKGYYQKLY